MMNGDQQGQEQQPQQQLSDDLLLQEFRKGVTAVLRSWSALRTAVESGWGGVQSQEKAERLRDSILEYMMSSSSSSLDIQDLEDALAIYMEEEFSIQLEDKSEQQVARDVWFMHEGCVRHRSPLRCQQIISKLSSASSQLMMNLPSQAIQEQQKQQQQQAMQSSEFDDDEDDDDVMESTIVANKNNSYNYDDQSYTFVFGPPPKSSLSTEPSEPLRQLGEAPSEKPEMELDDDGFAPVTRKRRNNKR